MQKEVFKKELFFYKSKKGQIPFLTWIESQDQTTQSRIRNRLTRLEMGNMGNCKAMGEGIFELRLFFGSGYRIYFGEINKRKILLLAAGNKNSQNKDIERARRYWKEYKEESV